MKSIPALLALLCASAACAQSISGRVYDTTAAVVSGARVVLLQDFNKITETKSGDNGEFSFQDLKPGVYQVQVKQPYFTIFQQLVDLKEKPEARVYAVLHTARAETFIGIAGDRAPDARPGAPVKAYRAGGRVTGLKRISGRMPRFAEAAAKRGASGTVVLHGIITTDGSVTGIITLDSPDPDLEAEAVGAWETWKYEPMKLNGMAVETPHVFHFEFRYR